ncbi:hypothetical protein MA16_Dca022332 [Dendrobium catenatum]|uniref:Uncharacterized protein n=1 Tax=Dendrobium catenatum TaxID=906689 RepID=A0A2I0VNB4_9ASPA|nr:hypothetical protein MA16_Dca022332 [Dendrobium catenatum]
MYVSNGPGISCEQAIRSLGKIMQCGADNVLLFEHAVRLLRKRCREIARVVSLAHSWLFDFTPSTTLPSCRIRSYDMLIGCNNGSSLALKVTFSLSCSSPAKSRKSR